MDIIFNLFKSKSQFWLTLLLIVFKVILLRYFFYDGIHAKGMPGDILSLLLLLFTIELIIPTQWRRRAVIYWSLNFIISFTLFAATLYFAHFGTVPTYLVLGELNQVPQVKASVGALLRPQQFLYFADFVVLAVWAIIKWFLNRRNRSSYGFNGGFGSGFRSDIGSSYGDNYSFSSRRFKPTWGWKLGIGVVLAICVLTSGMYVKAGRSIDNELVRAESVGFINFQFDAVFRNQEEERLIAEGNLHEIEKQVAEHQASYNYKNIETDAVAKEAQYFGAAKGKNLIVVQMESFQNFPINLKIDGQEITPVLNQLAKEGLYFPHVYQQIGTGNTSDAEFMSNTSIYPTATVAMSKGFGNRQLPSLPRLLQSKGYVAQTYHINDVKFWDRHRLYPALNFDQYFDRPYYNNDHFNDFGASDEEMYRVGMEQLSQLQAQSKPFYAQFVTTSSHSPFVVPQDKRKITLPAELEGSNLGNYIMAINYTDYAIGQLINSLKQQGMWENTILAFYGDHFGIQPTETGAEEITAKLGIPYDDRISRFNIPFIIHIPGESHGKVIERTGGQLDIMPTLANLLGISLKDAQFTAFGQDLLNIDHNVVGMRYYLPTGSFFNDDILFVPGEGFDDGQATSINTLEPVTDFAKYRSDYDYILELMKLSDQYVKLLPKR
ncbi:phosphoglycerol transferase MdoB-like AlkP superfamily enzyme [Paenibacillus turicensis]|uniref:Phosphoglycerol transferase MdoB-like AlkP superfamily enzyme n=1 Tax=Paenibacillus turicensis TaxID=160487 RepID=A0ABS4FTY7_9BACL|nr:LTA synthase family protein [Paenibacillus turicensis]MBP1906047.1 phosphoglycerol transferase MdoB-like AlkP superfamily enzyme [Paenibacillus turicensis]